MFNNTQQSINSTEEMMRFVLENKNTSTRGFKARLVDLSKLKLSDNVSKKEDIEKVLATYAEVIQSAVDARSNTSERLVETNKQLSIKDSCIAEIEKDVKTTTNILMSKHSKLKEFINNPHKNTISYNIDKEVGVVPFKSVEDHAKRTKCVLEHIKVATRYIPNRFKQAVHEAIVNKYSYKVQLSDHGYDFEFYKFKNVTVQFNKLEAKQYLKELSSDVEDMLIPYYNSELDNLINEREVLRREFTRLKTRIRNDFMLNLVVLNEVELDNRDVVISKLKMLIDECREVVREGLDINKTKGYELTKEYLNINKEIEEVEQVYKNKVMCLSVFRYDINELQEARDLLQTTGDLKKLKHLLAEPIYIKALKIRNEADEEVNELKAKITTAHLVNVEAFDNLSIDVKVEHVELLTLLCDMRDILCMQELFKYEFNDWYAKNSTESFTQYFKRYNNARVKAVKWLSLTDLNLSELFTDEDSMD